MSLNSKERSGILGSIKKLVLQHHMNVAGIDYQKWLAGLHDRTPELLAADTGGFEAGVRTLLAELGSSHTGFYHERPLHVLPQHTINATFRRVARNGDERWMFLDVFEGGPAHSAGVRPGATLVAVDGVECGDDTPQFGFGRVHSLSVSTGNWRQIRTIEVSVPNCKGTTQRPPMVEPNSVTHAMSGKRTGVLTIRHFPGSAGIRFANTLDAAVGQLKAQGCDRLIVDLRGNIGGSLGFARLASYMCPGRTPIGHSLTPKRLRSGYRVEDLPRVPMPRTRGELLMTLAQFSLRDKSVMLLSQGLGRQPFHGRIAVVVNEWTNSAAEIVAGFAAEQGLARIVGRKTRGNVLGAMNFKVGSGYWLRLPIMGWFTSQGRSLESCGVAPDVAADISPECLEAGIDDQMATAFRVLDGL
jgi:C-terminal processing protease CtpA/Prc